MDQRVVKRECSAEHVTVNCEDCKPKWCSRALQPVFTRTMKWRLIFLSLSRLCDDRSLTFVSGPQRSEVKKNQT
ncbi:hypothetical protein BaRGS_00014075, partial [Batillaria attramentaria]